jgi:HEAT repeat protein
MSLRALLLLGLASVSPMLMAARPGLERLDWDALSDLRTSTDLNRLNRGPRWLDDYDQARHVAREQNTTLIVLFVRKDDPFSNRLKLETLSDPKVWRYLRRYTLVEVDADRDPELAFQFELQSTPALLWLDSEGRELHRAIGFAPPGDLTAYIERIQTAGAVELPPAQAGLLQAFEQNPTDRELMVRMLRALGQDENPRKLRGVIRSIRPAPVKVWVELLSHEALEIRMGSLELLEELSGDTFGFDPWEAPATQEAERETWRAWAEDHQGQDLKRFAPLTEVQLASAIRDLDNASEPHVLRAVRTLEAGGPALLPHIDSALKSADLSPQQQARLEEIRLSLRIAALGWADGPGVSFRLRRGPLDTRMQLLRDIAREGTSAIPILSQFLDDPEVLIRETAMEGLLQAGGSDALPVVLKRLEVEPSTDIALTAMRQLAKMKSPEATAWLKTQLVSEREERILGALTAMQSGAHDELAPVAIDLIADPRWRVRATAATTLGAIRHAAALPVLLKNNADPDAFARTATLDACLNILNDRNKRIELVNTWYEKNPGDLEVLIRVVCEKRIPLPDAMLEKIRQFKKDDILGVLQVIVDCADTSISVAMEFADHADEDVRASALRILAVNGLVSRNLKTKLQADKRLGQALREESDAVRTVLLTHLRMPDPNRNSSGNSFVPFTPYVPEGATGGSEELDELMGAFSDKVVPTPVPEPEGASLDDMLAAFEEPDTATASADGPGVEPTLRTLFAETASEDIRSLVALQLALIGDTEAISVVKDHAASYPTDSVIHLINRSSSNENTLPLIRTLLLDSRAEIRAEALEWMAGKATATEFLPLLDQLGTENSSIRLNDIPFGSWAVQRGFSELKSTETQPYITSWLTEKQDPTHEDQVRQVLAVMFTLQNPTAAEQEVLVTLTDSSYDPDIRALAWLSMLMANRSVSDEQAKSLTDDPTARVRSVLPFLYLQHNYKEWPASASLLPGLDINDSLSRGKWTLFLTPESESHLQALVKDPMPDVSFLAGLALHSNRKEVTEQDTWNNSFAVAKRSPWLKSLASSVFMKTVRAGTPNEQALAFLSSIHGPQILSSLNLRSGNPEATAVDPAAAPLDLAAGSIEESDPAPPVVLYFYEQGCGDCEIVSAYLETYLKEFPNLEIRSLDMTTPEASRLYTAIYRQQGIPLTKVGLTPMIAGAGLTGAGSEELTHERIGEIILSSLNANGDQWIPAVQAETAPETDFEAAMAANEPEASQSPGDTPERVASQSRPIIPAQGILAALLPAIALLLLPGLGFKNTSPVVLALLAGSLLPAFLPLHVFIILALVGTPFLLSLQLRINRKTSQSLTHKIGPTGTLPHRVYAFGVGLLFFSCGLALPLFSWEPILGLVRTGSWILILALTGIALLSRFRFTISAKWIAVIGITGLLLRTII